MELTKAFGISGWMSSRELAWLAAVAKEAKVIVEFGSYFGRSTRALADNTSGVVYAVDPWNGMYYDNDNNFKPILALDCWNGFTRNLQDLILNGTVIPRRMESCNFELDPIADLVFIDGDHRYPEVIKDIEKARQITKKGGIISGHDYGHPEWTGVKKAVNEQFKHFNVHETIWWTNHE